MALRGVIDRIRIGARLTSREELMEQKPAEGQDLLQKAKIERTSIHCLCQGEPSTLYLTPVKKDSGLHLRRMPRAGSQHHRNCVSYGGINLRAERLYTDDALVEEGDNIRVSIDGPMAEIVTEGFEPGDVVPRVRATPSIRRSSMTLLGLLNYLWEEAGLNVWWPRMDGKRGAWTVRSTLMEEAKSRTLSGRHRLADVLFMADVASAAKATASQADERKERNSRNLKDLVNRVATSGNKNEIRYALVIAEIDSFIAGVPGRHGDGISLKDFKEALWDNHKIIPRLTESFRNPIERLKRRVDARRKRKPGASTEPSWPADATTQGGDDYRLMGIFAVAMNKAGTHVIIKNGAVMETTRRFIPIASDYEGKVERLLYEAGRAFEKPLVYDGERWAFPDFILVDTDMEPAPVLEVYGYSGDEYEARKRAKHVEYVRSRTPYWHWDLKLSAAIPSFDAFPKSKRFDR